MPEPVRFGRPEPVPYSGTWVVPLSALELLGVPVCEPLPPETELAATLTMLVLAVLVGLPQPASVTLVPVVLTCSWKPEVSLEARVSVPVPVAVPLPGLGWMAPREGGPGVGGGAP